MTTTADVSVDPNMSFADAAKELAEIVGVLEAGNADVDQVATSVERASLLVEHCRAKVRGAEAKVRDITSKAAAAAAL